LCVWIPSSPSCFGHALFLTCDRHSDASAFDKFATPPQRGTRFFSPSSEKSRSTTAESAKSKLEQHAQAQISRLMWIWFVDELYIFHFHDIKDK
jgi:hypothetical protein